MNCTVPRRIKTAITPGFFVAVTGGATFLGIAAVVFFFNPGTRSFYPVCRFHQLTGLNCPGCGATRGLYALLHGHLQVALKDNAFFILLLATAAVRGLWLVGQKALRQPTGSFFPAKWLWPLLICALAFSVLRNLPSFSFLVP